MAKAFYERNPEYFREKRDLIISDILEEEFRY